MSMKKITLSYAALAVCGALALSACQSSESTGASSGTPTSAAGASSPTSQASSTSQAGSTSSASTTQRSSTSSAPASTPSAPPSTGGKASTSAPSAPRDDDSYAFTHLCTASQVTLQLTKMSDVPTRRLITVRNNAATSCGLSYYPLVSLGNAHSADHSKDIKPLIPGGLGGPPAYVLYAGKTAYAVVDLNPGGSGSAPATTLDEISVLGAENWPNAATKNFPLGGGSVSKPKQGLYERSAADAVASMQGANTPQ